MKSRAITAVALIFLAAFFGCASDEDLTKMWFVKQMFPDVKFYAQDGVIKGKDRPFNSYEVKIAPGHFTQESDNQLLIVALTHGEQQSDGFENINLAVFDRSTRMLLTAVKGISSDESAY
ncbi:MAG: hypothetical protein LLG37_04315, partial [Spirochaetia bacterium]|nr:hypothetical protein [Spirochaetia bacterium]